MQWLKTALARSSLTSLPRVTFPCSTRPQLHDRLLQGADGVEERARLMHGGAMIRSD